MDGGTQLIEPVSLSALNRTIARLMTVPATQNVWIVAELSDVSVRGGHCYMELLEKDERGLQVAKARGVIWAGNYRRIDAEFFAATGQRFATGLKVMLRVSASMHPFYGLSLVVSDVNPDFTMGDLLRHRKEIIARLTKEGVIEMNRSLQWPDRVWRIAIVSAPTAAGFGDFRHQLLNNAARLRFRVKLFPAIMQGEKAPQSIISALEEIAAESDGWDCVVIIRGGGATSDLQAFEDYELASSVAQFPLPVIIGIGHERDVTVLDWVAKMRVKTPTAAAEWLIDLGERQLTLLQQYAASILRVVTDVISSSKEQLSYYEGLLPVATANVLGRQDGFLQRSAVTLREIAARRLSPQLERLRLAQESLPTVTEAALRRQSQRLDAQESLVGALSPMAVLRRGYSMTCIDGKVLTSASQAPEGAEITTVMADGRIISRVTKKQ